MERRRPTIVTVALVLAGAGYALGILVSYLSLSETGLFFGPIHEITTVVLGAVISVTLLWLVASGWDWARIAFVVLTAIAVVQALWGLVVPSDTTLTLRLAGLGATLLAALAAIVLVLPEANAWYLAMRSPAFRMGVAPRSAGSASWYYLDGNERVGPLDEADLRGLLRMGELDLDTPVWTDGMPDWQQAGLALSAYGAAPSSGIRTPV